MLADARSFSVRSWYKWATAASSFIAATSAGHHTVATWITKPSTPQWCPRQLTLTTQSSAHLQPRPLIKMAEMKIYPLHLATKVQKKPTHHLNLNQTFKLHSVKIFTSLTLLLQVTTRRMQLQLIIDLNEIAFSEKPREVATNPASNLTNTQFWASGLTHQAEIQRLGHKAPKSLCRETWVWSM